MPQPKLREGRCLVCINEKGLLNTSVVPIGELHKVGNRLLCDKHYAKVSKSAKGKSL